MKRNFYVTQQLRPIVPITPLLDGSLPARDLVGPAVIGDGAHGGDATLERTHASPQPAGEAA
jgi:hypothetical protein